MQRENSVRNNSLADKAGLSSFV